MHAFLLTLALAAAPSPFAAELPGYSTLESRQREIFETVASQEFCGCDSALTLMGCLKQRPKCQLGFALGEAVVRASRSGAAKSAVSSFISQGVVGPYCSIPTTIDVTGAARIGAVKAPLQVVEFADFRCTHCRQAMPLVHEALRRWGDKVSLVYMPVALVENSESSAAGEASLAALAQGKFWPMHKALFAREAGDYTPEVLRGIAKSVGLNMKRFNAEMQAHTHAALLHSFRERFLALGLDGTPAMYVNGRRFDLEPGAFDLSHRLQLEEYRNTGGCN